MYTATCGDHTLCYSRATTAVPVGADLVRLVCDDHAHRYVATWKVDPVVPADGEPSYRELSTTEASASAWRHAATSSSGRLTVAELRRVVAEKEAMKANTVLDTLTELLRRGNDA